MSFFKNKKVENLLERHVRRIAGIEDTQAIILLKQFKKARATIKQQLEITPEGTFTEAQLTSTLLQVESILQGLESRINQELILGSRMSSDQGVEDMIKEVNTFEKMFTGVIQAIPFDAVLEAIEPKNYLINQYKSSLESYSETTRAKIQHALTQAVITRKTIGRTVADVEQILANEEWKLLRIVRTELHNIYNNSKMNSMELARERYVPDLMKSLYHPMDHRTGDDSKQVAKNNPIVPIGKPFKYTVKVGNKDVTREFMAPPDRPNDRSILMPYRKEWEK